jgi:hypothetical protein
VFSLLGYAVGMGAGIFFKNKFIIRNTFSGFGGSYAIVRNQ